MIWTIASTLLAVGVAGCMCSDTHVATDALALDAASLDVRVAEDATGPRLARDARYDFDGDGHGDLVVGDPTYRAGRGAVWLIRASEGGPLPPMLIAEGEPDEGLGEFVFPVSDQDRDGRYEVGTYQRDASGSGWRGRWLGTGRGGDELPALGADDFSGGLSTVRSADLDADPAPDVVATYSCGRSCYAQLEITRAGVVEVPTRSASASFVIPVARSARFGLIESVEGDVVLRLGGGSRRIYGVDGGTIDYVENAGDVDGDGETDVIVGVSTPSVSLRLLLTRLGDAPRTQSLPGSSVPDGDRNCDGFDDLRDAFEDAWLPGGPDGAGEPVSPVPEGANAATGPDLDLDGCRDAVVLDTDPHVESGLGMPSWPLALPASVHRATAFLLIDDNVWARAPYAAPSGFRYADGRLEGIALPSDATFGDVNGDGWEDAIDVYGVGFWWGNGSGFDSAGVRPVPAGAQSWVLGDIDGDGDDEVLAGTATRSRTWIVRGGPAFPDEGTLATLVQPEPDLPVGLVASPLGDVDGDGRLDLIAFGTDLGHVWLARDLVAGDGVAHHAYGRPSYRSVMPSDVDGDGLDDIVLADTLSVRVHPGRRDAAPDPEAWEVPFPDRSWWQVGPDGLLLSAEPTGTTLRVQRLTRTGAVDHASLTVPVSVRGARFEGRLLVLPRAEEDGAHVYRVRRGALEGPTLVTLPPGIPVPRPLSDSPNPFSWAAR